MRTITDAEVYATRSNPDALVEYRQSFPTRTFLKAWNYASQEDQYVTTEWKAAFTRILTSDGMFGGYEVVQQLSAEHTTSVWNDNVRLKPSSTRVMPTKECFRAADYGQELFDAIVTKKCFPPFYPRHTLYGNWLHRIRRMRNDRWITTERNRDHDTNVRISKSIELKKLFVSVDVMLGGIQKKINQRHPSDHEKIKNTSIVDEIYLTEQLCNLLYGMRYILDHRALMQGKWITWENADPTIPNTLKRKLKFHAWDVKSDKLPENVKQHVLSTLDAKNMGDMLHNMMQHCVGIDFRLPYLRVNELSKRDKVELWPSPTDTTMSYGLKPRVCPPLRYSRD